MIVVVGAGVAGLGASLALARDGHDVTLIERDGIPDWGSWTPDVADARPGCPQVNQGHSFLARARTVLEQHAPDLIDSMLVNGGNKTDGNLILPPEHYDPELATIAIRRGLIDTIFLNAVRAESRIALESGTVTGLVAVRAPDGIPTITGVTTSNDRTFACDLVVDASGRRSSFPALVEEAGGRAPAERSSPCGLAYYGRFMEVLPDAPPPPMFAPVIVRGSLGYLAFAIFVQERRVIILAFGVETADREMRALRSERAFMAACRSIKPMMSFADESYARPLSSVVSMGGLQNVHRSYVAGSEPVARGLVVIGDGLCHTDPTPAYGMSMALDQAFRLPRLVRAHGECAQAALEAEVGDELDERYEHVARGNRERMEFAQGRTPDPETDREWVVDTGAQLLARNDPGVLRRYLRRVLCVDRPSALHDDAEFMTAARAALVEAGSATKRRRPERETLLKIMADAEPSFA